MPRFGKNDGEGILGIWQREIGGLSPKIFKDRLAASEDLVLRLGIQRKLNQHRGCVNTVSFNDHGDILISGSDDRMVLLWDWEAGKVELSFHSGHSNNVFQARFMPFTNDQTIVTCGADGEVRLAEVRQSGEVSTSMLAQHDGRAHKLAIEPGSSRVFYSCGEDGLVQRFDLRTRAATELFVCRSAEGKSATSMPIVSLNAIVLDPRNPNYFAVAGNDRYAHLYDVRKYISGKSNFGQPCDCFCPPKLINAEGASVTGLAFSYKCELLVSYHRDFIYLFSKDQGLGSEPSNSTVVEIHPKVYNGHINVHTIKGVNFYGPNCEYVVSGSDCGRLFIWRKKDGELLRVMEADSHVVNCIEPHPHSTTIASSGIEKDVKIWTPNAIERAAPVDMNELTKRKKTRFCQYADPELLITQMLAQRIQRGDGSTESTELLDFLMNQINNNDSSSDENPPDCTVS